MTDDLAFRDALYRLAQVGERMGVQLVRIVSHQSGNRYTAKPIEFAGSGQTQQADTYTLSVTNLAEPADSSGEVPDDSDVVALDVEGRWVIFVRQAESQTGAAAFPAKVIEALDDDAYSVREQVIDDEGQFSNKPGAATVTALNLAELSLGPGAAVDDDTIVLVTSILDTGDPPTLRYVFDHPAYAKYLD